MNAPDMQRQRTWSDLVSLHTGQAVGLAGSLASVALVSRLLGPTQYGQFALVMTAAQYAMTVAVSWTSAALIRFGREEYTRTGHIDDVFWTRLSVATPCVAIVAGLLFAFRPQLSRVLPVDMPLPLVVAIVLALVSADQADGALQAAGAWPAFAWLVAVEKATLIGVVVAAAVSGRLSLTVAVLAAIASQAVRSGMGFWSVQRALRKGVLRFDAPIARAIVRYAWPQIFTFTIGYASAAVEPFLIRRYASVADVGVYQVAFQLSLACVLLLGPMSSLLFPAATSLRIQNRSDVLKTVIHRLVPQVVFLLNVLLTLGMLVAAALFQRLFGAPYAAGTRPLLVLLAGVSFQIVTAFYSPLLAAYDLTKHSAVLNTAGGIAMHLLPELLLISWWGMTGAAASWFVWYAFSASFCVVVVAKRVGVRRLSTLAYPLIPIAELVVLLAVHDAFVRLAATVVILSTAFAVVRRRHLFRVADVVMLEALGVPQPLLRVAMRAYAAL